MLFAAAIYILSAIAFYAILMATAKFEPELEISVERSHVLEWLEAKRSQPPRAA